MDLIEGGRYLQGGFSNLVLYMYLNIFRIISTSTGMHFYSLSFSWVAHLERKYHYIKYVYPYFMWYFILPNQVTPCLIKFKVNQNFPLVSSPNLSWGRVKCNIQRAKFLSPSPVHLVSTRNISKSSIYKREMIPSLK